MPRVHVTAKHHDLILEIGSGYLGDGVVAHRISILPCYPKVDRHLYCFAGLEHSHNSVVLLNGKHHLRCHLRSPLVISRNSATGNGCIRNSNWLRNRSRLKKEGSPITSTGVNYHCRAFLLEESQLRSHKLKESALGRCIWTTEDYSSATGSWLRSVSQCKQLFVGQSRT